MPLQSVIYKEQRLVVTIEEGRVSRLVRGLLYVFGLVPGAVNPLRRRARGGVAWCDLVGFACAT